jgi:hypothetical protein
MVVYRTDQKKTDSNSPYEAEGCDGYYCLAMVLLPPSVMVIVNNEDYLF